MGGEVSGKTPHELANLRRGGGEVLVAVVNCEAGDFSFAGHDGANGLNARHAIMVSRLLSSKAMISSFFEASNWAVYLQYIRNSGHRA